MEDFPLRRALLCRAAVVAALFTTTPLAAVDPVIDHQPVPCSLPGKHPRICATIADDGVVKRARLYFRAAGRASYYWSEMVLDFRTFCATLPVPLAETHEIEYHIWAVDDEMSIKRTTDFEMAVEAGKSCPNPIVDEDPERLASLVVSATTRDQGKKLLDFVAEGVEFRRVKKR